MRDSPRDTDVYDGSPQRVSDSSSFIYRITTVPGPRFLVAPVTTQGAVSRTVYFPAGADWVDYFNRSAIYPGGAIATVPAPLEILPLFERV